VAGVLPVAAFAAPLVGAADSAVVDAGAAQVAAVASVGEDEGAAKRRVRVRVCMRAHICVSMYRKCSVVACGGPRFCIIRARTLAHDLRCARSCARTCVCVCRERENGAALRWPPRERPFLEEGRGFYA